MPLLPVNADVVDSDLAVDVFLSNYRAGQAISGDIGDIPIGFFWRPKIELASRVYSAKSRTEKLALRLTYKMPWSLFLKRILSPRFLFLPVPIARTEDAEWLLANGLIKMFKQIRRRI
jgi:hypothetical protein